jgi:hypothetical protein
MECFDIAILCRYLDQELDDESPTAQHIAAHLGVCERCAHQFRLLQEADAMLRRTWLGPQLPDVPGPICYSSAELSAYMHGLLPPQEAARFEQHLHTCDVCLREVMAIHATQHLLQGEKLLAPPAHLLATPKTYMRLGALIIQVAQNGLKFLESMGVPEDVRLIVGGHVLPAGALRGTPQDVGAAALLDIQQTAGEVELSLRMLHEEQEAVLLTIQAWKRGSPLGHQRMELLRHGRMLYSAPTSASGESEALRLVPGEYTVRLPEEHVETQYILRSAHGITAAG